MANLDSPSMLTLDQQTRNANHRVLFRLAGTKSNRMGIGARVTVLRAAMEQVNEVRGGGSYNSCNDTRLHFGLGSAATMTRVEVRWPSGHKQEFLNVDADAIYKIHEETGLHRLMSLPPPRK